MGLEEAVNRVKERIGANALGVRTVSPNQAFIDIPPNSVVEVNNILFNELKGRLATVTGLDTRDGIEVLYHYAFDDENCIITLKTVAAKPEPSLDSVGTIIPGALWIEREIHDLLGVEFRNHPDMRRLILSDDWPEGVYPLRRDYEENESQNG